MNKPVLIVVDMVNDFLDRWDSGRRRQLVEAINCLGSLMHGRCCPVIWVKQEFEPDLSDAFAEMKAKGISMTIKGTAGCQIDSELAVGTADRVIVKKRYSAFFGTNLDEILREIGPDAIVVAGINTHACIRMTAIDAYQRDWPVVLAGDCIDSYDRRHHEISIEYMNAKIATVLSNHEIECLFSAQGQTSVDPELAAEGEVRN